MIAFQKICIQFPQKTAKVFYIIVLAFVSCSTPTTEPDYLFKEVPVEKSQITFKNTLKEDANHSIINYIYYYNGGGVAAGDINNDGLDDLFFVSNTGKNKLYLNKGNLNFEDISSKANIEGKASWSTGVSMVDINQDGLLDIYVCAVSGLLDFEGHNELYINNGDGTFSEKAKEFGLDFKGYATQAYFFDYDKDNDLDVYIVNHAVHTNVSYGPASVRSKRAPLVGDVLLQNTNGLFKDVSEQAGIFGGSNGYGLSASIADFNNDGWDDLYIANDFHEDDYYYINNRDGSFTEQLKNAFSTISRFSMGSDAADINGDGLQDLITLDMLPSDEQVLKYTEGDDAMFNMQERLRRLGYKDQYSRNMLQINTKEGYFKETAFLNNISNTDWSWAPLIADYDNDGFQDIFISNGIHRRPNDLDFKKYVASTFKKNGAQEGVKWLYNAINEMPSGKVPNQFFKGNAKLFKETTTWMAPKPTSSNSAIYVDLDLDGDLDLAINNLDDLAGIYENTINDRKNFVTISLSYTQGNSEGLGSKILLYSGNTTQTKQVYKTRGFLSSTNSKIHFGFDTIAQIDSIQVIWPNNTIQTLKSPELNTALTITFNEKSPTYTYKTQKDIPLFTVNQDVAFKHTEDSYNDFNFERLIPYQVSKLGPAVAIGDIDKNGYEDIFIGNASGKRPKLYLNTGTTFTEKEIPEISKDYVSEDNDAVFFDADNDGDLDLYIATGISFLRRSSFEEDRLYINTNGNFEPSQQSIPKNSANTSCVVAYDYDNDGDEDLFIGNLSDPSNFGKQTASYILKNNGKGVFTKDENFSLTAMVTSAIWKDLNNDGVKDLIVATEWDAPKLYINTQGQLRLVKTPENLNGLWQAVHTFDIDGDGDEDILLGNWGLNTKFTASDTNPLLMYYSDFDQNGKNETVLAHFKKGAYYSINSKDELASQMNIINKRFTTYKEFSTKTIEEILTPQALRKATKFEVHTLASGYLENKNGAFEKFIPFPNDFQLAPINSFNRIEVQQEERLLISGNNTRVNTYHGSYRALKGLIVKTVDHYQSVSELGMKPFNEQVKATPFIKMNKNNSVWVISNNDSIQTYTIKN